MENYLNTRHVNVNSKFLSQYAFQKDCNLQLHIILHYISIHTQGNIHSFLSMGDLSTQYSLVTIFLSLLHTHAYNILKIRSCIISAHPSFLSMRLSNIVLSSLLI